MIDTDYFSLNEGIKRVVSFAGKGVIGALFHPSYMLVNAKFLGSHEITAECAPGDEKTIMECVKGETYLAAFGIASSTIGICLLSVSMCFAMGLN